MELDDQTVLVLLQRTTNQKILTRLTYNIQKTWMQFQTLAMFFGSGGWGSGEDAQATLVNLDQFK